MHFVTILRWQRCCALLLNQSERSLVCNAYPACHRSTPWNWKVSVQISARRTSFSWYWVVVTPFCQDVYKSGSCSFHSGFSNLYYRLDLCNALVNHSPLKLKKKKNCFSKWVPEVAGVRLMMEDLEGTCIVPHWQQFNTRALIISGAK